MYIWWIPGPSNGQTPLELPCAHTPLGLRLCVVVAWIVPIFHDPPPLLYRTYWSNQISQQTPRPPRATSNKPGPFLHAPSPATPLPYRTNSCKREARVSRGLFSSPTMQAATLKAASPSLFVPLYVPVSLCGGCFACPSFSSPAASYCWVIDTKQKERCFVPLQGRTKENPIFFF